MFDVDRHDVAGHRIRHYGLFASNVRADNLAIMRALIALSSLLPQVNEAPKSHTPSEEAERCPKCGGPMQVILRFEGACRRRNTPPVTARFDTS